MTTPPINSTGDGQPLDRIGTSNKPRASTETKLDRTGTAALLQADRLSPEAAVAAVKSQIESGHYALETSFVRDLRNKLPSKNQLEQFLQWRESGDLKQREQKEREKLQLMDDNEVQARLALDIIRGKGFDDLAFILREMVTERKPILTEFVSKLEFEDLVKTLRSTFCYGVPSCEEWINLLQTCRNDEEIKDLTAVFAKLRELKTADSMEQPGIKLGTRQAYFQDEWFLQALITRQITGETEWLKPLAQDLFDNGFGPDTDWNHHYKPSFLKQVAESGVDLKTDAVTV